MDVLLELLIKLLSLTVIMIFLIGLLFVMLISVVYIAGYVYDSIFGNSFIRNAVDIDSLPATGITGAVE